MWEVVVQSPKPGVHVKKRSTTRKKLKSHTREKEAHTAGASPCFCSMKQLRVLLLPPGWDASASAGLPRAVYRQYPSYSPGWRETMWGKVPCLRITRKPWYNSKLTWTRYHHCMCYYHLPLTTCRRPFHSQKCLKSKFNANPKFHFVKYFNINSTMWKYCWRGFVWMVTP